MTEYEETMMEYRMALKEASDARDALLEATRVIEITDISILKFEAKLRQLRKDRLRG
jgi:hypothetical protein